MKGRNVGILLSYANNILSMFCGVFISAFALRVLGDVEYGVYKAIGSFVAYLVLFEFGTGSAMTRNLSVCRAKNVSKDEFDRNVGTIWAITNALALLILLCSFVFYYYLGDIYSKSMSPEQIAYGEKIFLYSVVFLISSFFNQTFGGIILAFEYYWYSASVNIVRLTVRTALLVAILLSYKHSIVIAIVDMALGLAIAAFSYCFCRFQCGVRFSVRKFDYAILKNVAPLCLAISIQVLVNQANNNVDNFVIGIMLDPQSVALYSIALYIYNTYSSFSTIPISMYAPQIVREVARGARGKELTDLLVQPSRLITLVGGAVLFGFVACGRPFVELVYGRNYSQAWGIALIIMSPMFINMANGAIINVLDATNKRLARSYVLFFTTMLNIVLTVWWLRLWGIVGAAIATAVATIIGQVVIMNVYYSRVIKIRVFYLFARAFRGILGFQIVGAVAGFALASFASDAWLAFLIGGATFVAIAGGGYVLWGTNDVEAAAFKRCAERLRKRC